MDKRYQVFVSSTYEDLIEERKEVIQALLELDCIPAGMELFPAADEEQWSLIKRVIDDCDYYIVIIGGRYGSVDPKSNKSYTQMEYEYAVEKNKPVIAFTHKKPGDIIASKSESDPEKKAKLDEFLAIVKKKMVKPWMSPEELGSVVSRSLVKLIKDKPGVGWVRADVLPDNDIIKENLELRKKIENLNKAIES